MKTKALPLIALLTMSFAACQRQESAAERAAVEGAAVLQARTDGRLPANLPAFLPVYPGARVTSTVEGGPRGGTVAFVSSAASATVAEFYRSRAIAAGLRQQTDVSSNAVRILMFDDASQGHRNFVLTITQTPSGVQAAVTYGPQS